MTHTMPRAKTGRSTKTVGTNVPVALAHRIEAMAQERGLYVSELLRDWIGEALDRHTEAETVSVGSRVRYAAPVRVTERHAVKGDQIGICERREFTTGLEVR